MAAPVRLAPETQTDREEGFLHYVAREGRTALRWTIGISLIAIVVCMVTLWFLAVVPALILLTAYTLLALTEQVERHSDAAAHHALEESETAIDHDVIENHAEDDQLQPVDAKIVNRETKIGAGVLIAATLTALLIASILFNVQVVAIGSLVVFAYMLLISAPFWLGWFNNDIEDEARKLEGRPQSARVKTE